MSRIGGEEGDDGDDDRGLMDVGRDLVVGLSEASWRQVRGLLEGRFGASWGLCWASWGLPGASWRAPWGALGASWGPLGASCRPLGAEGLIF